jgi:signal peptidase I
MLENEKDEITETETVEDVDNMTVSQEFNDGDADIDNCNVHKDNDFQTDTNPTKNSDSFVLRFLSGVFDYVEILALSVCLVLVIFTLFGRLCRVSGDSMNRTLLNGETLLISNLVEVEQEDIVVFHMTTDNESYVFLNEPLVKRVIAKGGQTITFNFADWTVSVDGEIVDEPYINRVLGAMKKGDITGDTVTVPEGCYFVMGDNRNFSADSRYDTVGFVKETEIVGHTIVRLSPVFKALTKEN